MNNIIIYATHLSGNINDKTFKSPITKNTTYTLTFLLFFNNVPLAPSFIIILILILSSSSCARNSRGIVGKFKVDLGLEGKQQLSTVLQHNTTKLKVKQQTLLGM